jgi:hypothetical protein
MAMVNGESSAILLFLDYYANSSSTLSAISFPLPIAHSPLSSSTLSIISYPLSFEFIGFASTAGGAA